MMLLDAARQIDPSTFQADSETVLVRWVRELYGAGWQPTELIRFAQMRDKAAGADLIRRAIAAERDTRTGPTTSDPGWRQQWDAAELSAGPTSPGWVAAWAVTSPADQWLRLMIRLAATLGSAPRLELLLPPPPGVRSSTPLPGRPVATAADPVLERVRGLLAKAESTDHEAEATSFTAKAQELMTKHAIDLALLESSDPNDSTPTLIRVPIDPPYADAKALLLQTVAEQSRCRSIHMSGIAMSNLIGFPTDLEGVDLLFTSLLVQGQKAMAVASATAPPGARTRSQAFRAAFLLGFTGRIGERLAEVNRLAFADADGDAFLPVLRSHDTRIDAFIEQHFSDTRDMQVRGGSDPLGYAHGELAGDTANLTSGFVDEGRDEPVDDGPIELEQSGQEPLW